MSLNIITVEIFIENYASYKYQKKKILGLKDLNH